VCRASFPTRKLKRTSGGRGARTPQEGMKIEYTMGTNRPLLLGEANTLRDQMGSRALAKWYPLVANNQVFRSGTRAVETKFVYLERKRSNTKSPEAEN